MAVVVVVVLTQIGATLTTWMALELARVSPNTAVVTAPRGRVADKRSSLGFE